MQGIYLHRITRKTRINIHAPSGIRTHDPSVRTVEDITPLDSTVSVVDAVNLKKTVKNKRF
jgi:hypothetical protein